MKKRRLLYLALLPLVLCLLLGLCGFALPYQYRDTYLAALPDKAEALAEAAKPKIVLIGGSGVAFSADCSLLRHELPGYDAVNFGLYAGLGTAVMLELALPSIQEGDIVVFSPELSAQTLSDWFDPEAMWQACETRPELIWRLDPSRMEGMAAAFPGYAAQKARFFCLRETPESSGVYARDAFTPQGDIRAELREQNVMPGGYDVNAPLSFEGLAPTDAFLRRLNSFADACQRKGARVYFRFCPMNRSAFIEGEDAEAMDAFARSLADALKCPLLGSAERAIMDSGWFYDTNFHLNGAGAKVNTLLLAEELREELRIPSQGSAVFPEMPGFANVHASGGDSSDAECFLYEVRGESVCVTGVTEAGKGRASLTLPASYQGLPVVSMTADALKGCESLERLTIQENFRQIPDGAFSSCPRLARITLLQADPAQCSVGQGLLDGCGARIFVPAGSFGRYCTNYFWSVHASRLDPMEMQATETPVITPSPAPAATEKASSIVRLTYEGCGGTLRGREGDSLTVSRSFVHLRENTLQGSVWFRRDGYVLTGWNTAEDGSGIRVGLGSRYDLSDGDRLYAQWLPCAPETDFAWEISGTGASITGYHGSGGVCVLPEAYQGLPVTDIRKGAFEDASFSLLVFSPALRHVEEGAFLRCGIEELLLFDSLKTIGDACFADCVLPRTLRVNACTNPVYSGSYFDTFQDKYDYLLSLSGQHKLVLSSGSSGRYGYDCTMLKAAFQDLAPVNMGVYAYTSALPQLMLMLPLLEEGDVLLYAPEFDAVPEQFCVTNRLDYGFFAMMESSYDTGAALDMRAFSGVYDTLGEYLRQRARMPGRSYDVSPAQYDDDGNAYPFATYNRYGDFVLPRPDEESDERKKANIADYTVQNITSACIRSLNEVLAPFTRKGVRVLFSYTPRNSASLTEQSTPENRRILEEKLQKELDVPVISRLEDSLMPGHLFWLIDSHLGTNGAKLRTERIIADLKRTGVQ